MGTPDSVHPLASAAPSPLSSSFLKVASYHVVAERWASGAAKSRSEAEAVGRSPAGRG